MYDLTSAAKDANDLANYFARRQQRYAHVHVLTLADGHATKSNILSKVRPLLLKSKVDDEVVLFFAGHGLLDSKLDYYFGTWDINFNHPAARGYPMGDRGPAGRHPGAQEVVADGHLPCRRSGQAGDEGPAVS